jgi:hypothetical protein
MSHVSDSDHCRLEAVVFPDSVVESHQISDASRGLSKSPAHESMANRASTRPSGFGEVHLQSQDSDEDVKRALEVIPTRGVKPSLADLPERVNGND